MDAMFLRIGAVLAGLGVALGAFGAHGLRDRLSPEMLAVFETGVRYQMYHALALLVVGLAWARWPSTMLVTGGWLFVVGIALFSGSLYLLAITGTRWWGAVTPLGGLAFLAAWVLMALAITKRA
jgi:uncharacterized membrane protein YgdD (TMEM256/DUF423 family)